MLLGLICFTACSDDDENSGTPVITGVTTTTPGDDYFTEADRGQMIVIEGQNLGGCKEVYINDQSVYLNPTLATSTHIIVTIPTDLKLCAEDQSLRGEIRVVTTHGEAAYTFHIIAPEQWMTEYIVDRTADADGSMVAVPGGNITIKGKNFYDLERVFLTTDTTTYANPVEISDIRVNSTFDEITGILPSQLLENGFLVVECQTNTSAMDWARKAFPPAVITSISSDMPIPGTPVVIKGENFVKVVGLDICGDYLIPASDLTVNEEGTEIRFSLPKLPASGSTPGLGVVTASGKTTTLFYDYASLVADGGDLTTMSFSWGADPVDNGGTLDGHPAQMSGRCWGINGPVKEDANIWWWGVMVFDNTTWPTSIPDNTPLENLELRIETYVGGDPVRFSFRCFDSDSYFAQGQATVDYVTGETPSQQWFTMAIPFTSFTKDLKTYKDWRDLQEKSRQMGIYTNDVAIGKNICTYFDNFRVVIKK